MAVCSPSVHPRNFHAMSITLKLANQVRRLSRQGMTVEQIAVRLGLPQRAITDALSSSAANKRKRGKKK